MESNNELYNFLEISQKLQGDYLVLTNLEKVILIKPQGFSNNYVNINLSKETKNIIELCKESNLQEYFFKEQNTIPIIKNDRTKYSAQIILPILYKYKIEGLLINFKIRDNYINSDLIFSKTTREFIYKFLEKEDFKKKLDIV